MRGILMAEYVFPKFEKRILSNGLTVFSENRPESNAALMGLNWFSYLNEKNVLSGLLCHEMMGNSTNEWTQKQLREKFEENFGAQLYVGRNGSMMRRNQNDGRILSWFTESVANKAGVPTIQLLKKMVSERKFSAKQFDDAKTVAINQVKDLANQKFEWVGLKLMEKTFEGQILEKPLMGNEEELKKINLKSAQEFYEAQFVPKNLTIYAQGPNEMGKMEKELEKIKFKEETPWKFSPLPAYTFSQEGMNFEEKVSGADAYYAGIFPLKNFDETNFAAWRVLTSIIGMPFVGRIWKEIREKLSLSYRIGAGLNPFLQTIHIVGLIDQKKTELGEEKIGEIVQDVANGNISNDEFLRAKQDIQGAILETLDDPRGRQFLFESTYFIYQELDSVERFFNELEKVSFKEVRRAAKKIQPQKRNVFWLKPTASKGEHSHTPQLKSADFSAHLNATAFKSRARRR